MIKRVLIIGGYGNFGSFITKKLAQDSNIQVIITGRSEDKAKKLASELDAINKPETYTLDINDGLTEALKIIRTRCTDYQWC